MDITIRYMPTAKDPFGAIERLTTPLESGYDRVRSGFRCFNGVWCLAVERWGKGTRTDEWTWLHSASSILLKHEGGSLADYEDFLERKVAYVAIDGITFWSNSALGGDE